MKGSTIIAVAFAVGFMHACVAEAAEVTVERDTFKPNVVMRSPVRADQLEHRTHVRARLSAAYMKAEPTNVKFALGVRASYSDGWRRYTSAWSDKGEELQVEGSDRGVSSCRMGTCSYYEQFMVLLSPSMVERAALGEVVQLKVVAQSGHDFVYRLHPEDVRALLSTAAQQGGASN